MGDETLSGPVGGVIARTTRYSRVLESGILLLLMIGKFWQVFVATKLYLEFHLGLRSFLDGFTGSNLECKLSNQRLVGLFSSVVDPRVSMEVYRYAHVVAKCTACYICPYIYVDIYTDVHI